MRSSSRIEGGAPSPLSRALGLAPRDWIDLAVAATELALARARLAMSGSSALLQRAAAAGSPTREEDERVERVRLAIARVSHRLPWRADCLVQAVAAQHWLRRLGVETSLHIGIPGERRDRFEAHAWLMHGDEVVTGGDVRDYLPLLDPASHNRSRQS
jgi:hypothetical protein